MNHRCLPDQWSKFYKVFIAIVHGQSQGTRMAESPWKWDMPSKRSSRSLSLSPIQEYIAKPCKTVEPYAHTGRRIGGGENNALKEPSGRVLMVALGKRHDTLIVVFHHYRVVVEATHAVCRGPLPANLSTHGQFISLVRNANPNRGGTAIVLAS
jgi:hypothetical protein